METNAERCKRDYYFYKTHGVCVSCHKEMAMVNNVRCPDCADKLAKHDAENYQKLKSNPEYRCKMSDYRRELRQRRRDAGICYVCGKRPVAKGYVRCRDCLTERRQKKDKRYKNDIPRNERPSYGLCYFCGEKAEDGKRTCAKHYNQLATRLAEIRDNPSEATLAQREYLRGLNSLLFNRIKKGAE
jgi:hypothetical protein